MLCGSGRGGPGNLLFRTVITVLTIIFIVIFKEMLEREIKI